VTSPAAVRRETVIAPVVLRAEPIPSAEVPRRRAPARLVLTLAVLTAVALLVPRLGYIPMWDGRAYAECAVEASFNGLSSYYLRCWGHAAHFSVGALAVPQLLDHGNAVLLIAVNALAFAAAAAGFHRLVRRVCPAARHDLDVALLTAAFLLQPAMLASVLQPGIDLPVLAGILWCTALLIESRAWWCAAAGLVVVFSKETGVMLYGVVLACYAGWLLLRGGTATERLRRLFPATPALVPLVVFAGYVLYYRVFLPGQSAIWTAAIDKPLLEQFLVPRVDRYLGSNLALLLVLNFAWVLSIWLVADAGVGAVRTLRRLPRRSLPDVDSRVLGFLTALALVSVYALTRFLVFSNVRYLLPAAALVLITSFAALLRLGLPTTARRALVATYGLLLAVSAVRTADPVSRKLWGTFQFGSHRMLRMTSLTGECCGIGRDQLVYSLEFARIHDLTDMALAALAPDSSTLIVIPALTSWYTIGPLDATTHRRTLRRTNIVVPPVVEHTEILKAPVRPQEFLYLALPNGNNPRSLRDLAAFYDIGVERRFERDGYAVSTRQLTLRP